MQRKMNVPTTVDVLMEVLAADLRGLLLVLLIICFGAYT